MKKIFLLLTFLTLFLITFVSAQSFNYNFGTTNATDSITPPQYRGFSIIPEININLTKVQNRTSASQIRIINSSGSTILNSNTVTNSNYTAGVILEKGKLYLIEVNTTCNTCDVISAYANRLPLSQHHFRLINLTHEGANSTNVLLYNPLAISYNVSGDVLTRLISPDTSAFSSSNITFVINHTTYHNYNLTNVTLYVWNNTGLYKNNYTSLSGNNNLTYLNTGSFTSNSYIWNAYTCASNGTNHQCEFAVNNKTFTQGFSINSVSYNSTTVVTRAEGYVLNATLNNPSQLSSINFVFNGISESASYSLNGNEIIINNLETSSTAGTNTFYWSFNFGGVVVNTTSYSQTVNSISAPLVSSSSCSGGGYSQVYNFSVYEESNLTQITNTSFAYVIYYGTTNGYSLNTSGSTTSKSLYLCMNFTASSSWKFGYGEIVYTSLPVESYPARKYLLFQNITVTSTTNSNVSLYSIPLADQSTFDLTVVERSTLLPYQGYYIGLLRWYPSTNEYRIVDMGILDDSGKTPIHVIVEDVDYRVAIYQPDGTLVYLANPRRLICLVAPCEYTLSIEGETINLNEFLDIQNSLVFNSTTGLWTFTWNDPSQRTTFMNLTIYQDLGDGSRVICSTGSSAYTGVITCNTSGYSGKLRGEVTRSASPPILLTQLITQIFSSPFSSKIGLFITFLLSALIILAVGYISPVFAIIGAIISLIPALYLGSISYFVISALAGLGGVILHVLNRA